MATPDNLQGIKPGVMQKIKRGGSEISKAAKKGVGPVGGLFPLGERNDPEISASFNFTALSGASEGSGEAVY